jgi:hypothetical protein
MEEPYYVLKTHEIFPKDNHELQVNDGRSESLTKGKNPNSYFRPEFISNYEKPLKSDIKKNIKQLGAQKFSLKDEEQDLIDLNDASLYLKMSVIPHLVTLLDSLTIMPIDSQSLEEAFHS